MRSCKTSCEILFFHHQIKFTHTPTTKTKIIPDRIITKKQLALYLLSKLMFITCIQRLLSPLCAAFLVLVLSFYSVPKYTLIYIYMSGVG